MARLPLQASADLQQELRRISTPVRLGKSSLLFAQGDRAKGAFLVEAGSVCLMLKASRGKTICQRTIGKGSLLGLPATINNTAYSLTAKAVSNVVLEYIPREKLVEAMNANLSLAIEILKVLSQEVHDMREMIRRKSRTGGSPRRVTLSR